MPSSSVRTFSDPDEYAASIRGTRAEMTVTARGAYAAKLVRLDLHRLWMQRFSENLPRIAHSAHVTGRAMFSFRSEPGPDLIVGGLDLAMPRLLRHAHADDYHHVSSGPVRFAAMSLPMEDVIAAGAAVGSLDLLPPRDTLAHAAPSLALDRLRRLHAAAGHLAEGAPEIIANAGAANGLEQALIGAMVDCLGGRAPAEDSSARGQHAIVLRRFRRVLEENPEQPLFIPEICKAIRVSERSLRACCQEHLGMSPKRYLLLRRMHLARAALRRAEPAAATVTDIATRYGFWQLGRFAVEYRSVFGETPSATLHRRRD